MPVLHFLLLPDPGNHCFTFCLYEQTLTVFAHLLLAYSVSLGSSMLYLCHFPALQLYYGNFKHVEN